MMQTIKELVEGLFVGQAIIATMVVGTACFLVGKEARVPEWFVGMTTMIVLWYFREQQEGRKNRQELKRILAEKQPMSGKQYPSTT